MTSQLADLVLPAATWLEQDDVVYFHKIWCVLARRKVARYEEASPKQTGRCLLVNLRLKFDDLGLLEKWLDEIQRPKDFPPTIIFKPEEMPAMAVHVTPMWNAGKDRDFKRQIFLTDTNLLSSVAVPGNALYNPFGGGFERCKEGS